MSNRKSEKSKKRAKSINTPDTKSQDEAVPEVTFDKSENTEEIRTIVINIDFFRNVMPLYPVSDIKARFKYLDKDIGETGVVPVTDDERLPLNQSIEIPLDINSIRQVDQLASNPIFLTAVQLSGTLDLSLYEQMRVSQNIAKPPEGAVESLFSLYEAFTGEHVGVKISDMKGPKKKGKKEKSDKDTENNKNKSRVMSVTSKSSKTSKKSKGSKVSVGTSKSQVSDVPTVKSEVYGMCVIDLISLFYGSTSFTETMMLQPVKRSCHILSTFKNFPEVTVTVSVKENVPLLDIQNVLNCTIESICNVPTLMTTEMDCKICVLVPLLNSISSPIVFHNPKITTKTPQKDVPKRWPGLHDIGYNANTTKYLIDTSFSDVKNKSNLDLPDAYKEETTRLEFNYIKRNILLRDGNIEFATHAVIHRKLVLEIYLTPKTKKCDKTYDVYSDDHDETKSKGAKIPPHLHLMAVLDIAALLYPGVTKVRVATPISTFTYEEAAKMGLEDSYFLPKPVDMGTNRASKTKLDTARKKKPEKKEKVPKKDKSSTVKEDKNLANLLPPKPEEISLPEPSVPVYNEDGKPCFIVADIELLRPINAKRDIEELRADLHQIQMSAITTKKTILNKQVAADFYRQTINGIVEDLNTNYFKYYDTQATIPQKDYGDFLGYLQKTGAYQSYLNTITTAATYVVTHKYSCEEHDFKNSKSYQNLISEIFSELISEMHIILNTLVTTGMKPVITTSSVPWDESFFYAKEAAELKLYSLAERYFLERIVYDQEDNPDFWFDYGIYCMEIGDVDKAYECLKETIAKNCEHKYALLLFGALLTQKGKDQEAETCFLNILVNAPRWMEGWCVLYLYYQKCDRLDGMDMAFEMGKKLCDEARVGDYFSDFENLSWSSKNIPNTMFFKTAILLVKMRLYSWAELALAQEITTPKYYGFVNYLLAVISYYQKCFDHALEHIEEAKECQGGDFAILGLSGHCLFAQGRLEEAKQEYFRVIESYDRPDDIHLVYLNCAQILAMQGNDQMARKLILIACKNHQTPYVWLTAGKLYFKENDILSAEECLDEANKKDNKHGDIWGYLTLLNLKLNRLHEAEQCYQQAIRCKLNDEELSSQIIEEFKKVNS